MTLGARVKRLLLDKFGSLRCRHEWALVLYRDRMFLRCPSCGAETQGFRIGLEKRPCH